MRSSPKLWFIVSVLALFGAAVFWRLGERRLRPARPPAAQPAGVTAAPPAGLARPGGAGSTAAPQTIVASGRLSRPPTNAAPPAVPAEVFARRTGEREQLRLRNTDRDLDQLTRDDRAVLLRNAFLDTRLAPPEVPAHLRAADEPGAYIVQSHGPVDQSLREYLAVTGAEVVSYLPNNAYLVKAGTAQAAQLRRSPRIAAVLPFEPWYKLEESLLRLARDQQPLAAGAELNVVLLPGTEAAAETALAGLGAEIVTRSRTPFGPQWALRAPADSLAPLARLAEVQTIEPRRSRTLLNDLTRQILGVSLTSTNEPLQGTNFLGLTGSNVWININDTGIDVTHPDLAGRVTGNDPSVLADFDGHGTHVAGTVAGNGSQSASITNLPGSVVPGADLRGKAPAAELYAQPIDLQTGPLISDAYLQENAATNYYIVRQRTGVPLSNNSWGYIGANEYDVAAASYDAAVRDALDRVTGEQPILYVFAAGNSGFGSDEGQDGEPGSISSPATAKNVITVGATELFREITNEIVTTDLDGNLVTNQVFLGETDSDDQVVSFSSRGNVGIGTEGRYGRFKPDVVAPGSFIASTRSSDWIDPDRFFSSIVQLYRDEEVQPTAVNNYLLYAPDNAESFRIRLLPSSRSPSPFPGMPLYLAYNVTPGPGDLVNTNNLVRVPPDRPFDPGFWFFSVGNPIEDPLFYSVLTVVTLTNEFGPYFEELKKLNAGLAPSYRYESGTSMAAPAVTGLLGLMQEWFQRENRTVSPALLKALLINGSRSLGPLYNFETRPTINYQGWGRPNLTNALPAGELGRAGDAGRPVQYVDQSPTNALATGESRTWLVDVSPNALEQVLKFTLVWTDPPGNPNAALKLVNDLDLIVTNLSSGEIFVGNDIPFRADFNTARTNLASATNDLVNNVENVLLRPRLGTNYSVTVAARRVNVNAVARHVRTVAQDFALALSVDNPALTNALNIRPLGLGPPEPITLTVVSNGVPLLGQRAGASSPLVGSAAGQTNQWRFYRFENDPAFTPVGLGLTNGSNVAFITFFPPNVAVPRFRDADVDLYVSQDPGLTNLVPAVLASAFKSTNQGGTELVFFTNSVIGDVYYVGVKSEDQQGGEYGFVSLSSDLPFTEEDQFGNKLVRGMPVNVPIPDGSSREPGAALIFGVSTDPVTVADVVVTNTIAFDSTGDILLNLSHQDQFVVLQNSALDPTGNGRTNDTQIYDDSLSGESTGFGLRSRPSDGPGSLQNFRGMDGAGVWLMTAVDNAILQGATNVAMYIKIAPQRDDTGQGVLVSLLPGQWEYYFLDVPALATNLTITVSALNPFLPVDVYIRRGEIPTPSNNDKGARISAPGGSLSIGTRDVPPLNPGRYFVGVFNPNAETLTFRLFATLDLDLTVSNVGAFGSAMPEVLRDDGTLVTSITVPVDRLVSDIKVGLRVEHPRVSDLVFHLVSPQGIRLLLAENRGGAAGRAYGADIGTNRIYTTFTDDTNLTQLPIKFGEAPFIQSSRLGGGAGTVVMDDGFELGAPGLYNTPDFFSAGWFLRQGAVGVVRNAGQAYRGSQYLGFQTTNTPGGTLFFTNLFLRAGNQYRLSFAYARDAQPAAAGLPQRLAVEMNGTNFMDLVVTQSTAGWYTTSRVFTAEVDINRLEFRSPGAVPVSLANPGFEEPVVTANFLHIPARQEPAGFGWRVVAGEVDMLPPTGWPGDPGQSLDMNGLSPGTIEQDVQINAAGVYQVVFSQGANPVPLVRPPFYRQEVFWGPTGGSLTSLGIFHSFLAPQPPAPPWNAGWQQRQSQAIQITTPGSYTLRFRSLTPGAGGPTLDSVEVRSLQGESAPSLDAIMVETLVAPSVAYYLPEEPLQPMVGSRALGGWSLEVTDSRAGPDLVDTGRLLDWRLDLIFALPDINAIRLTNGVPYFGTVRGNETVYFIVEAPRCSTESINLVAGPFASLLFFGDRDGLPVGQLGSFSDDYGPYLNVEPGGIASFRLSTNSPPAAPLRPGQRYYLGLRNLAGDTTNSFVVFVDFDCRDDDLANIPVLTNGVPHDDTIRPGSQLDYYQFNVSPRAIRATFELIPRNGNVDLYVKQYRPGDPQPFPNPNSFDYRSENAGTNVETIVVDRFSSPALQPGPWLLGILNAESAVLDYTVKVTEEFPQIIRLTSGVTYTNLITVTNSFDYYEFTVSGNAVRADFETLNQDGDVNLYVRRRLPLPVPSDAHFSGLNTGTNAEFITVLNTDSPVWLDPGDWYLGVENADSQPVNYGIRAMEFPGTVIPLTNTVAYTNLIGVGAEPQYYSFNVSTGAVQAAFEVFGMTEDVDLLLRQGLPLPTLNDHHYASSNLALADEQIVLTPFSFPTALIPGDWYLSVINRATNAATYTVRVTETVELITPLTNNIVHSSVVAPGARLDYYSFDVATNAVAATFAIPNLNGDVDLFIRRSLPLPVPGNAEFSGTNAGLAPELVSVTTNSLPPLTPGTWFLSVSNKTAAPVAYDILARQITISPPSTNIVVDIVVTNGQVCLTWNSIPGTNYFVVAKINVDDPQWTPVSPTLTATDVVTTFCLPLDPWRFFEVRIGDAPVVPVPNLGFTAIDVVGTNVCLTWDTAAGVSYYVEGKADITSPAWSVVPPGTIIATGTNYTLCVPLDLGYTVFRLQLGAVPPPPPARVLTAGEFDLDVLVNQICLRWFGRAGVLYQVEGADILTPPDWRPVSDVIVGEGREIQLCYTVGGPGLSFLRIIENATPPPPNASGQPVTVTSVGFDPLTASLCLTWPGVTGFEYVVEGKPALAEPRWTPLTGRLPATGGEMTYCVPLGQTDARYFQVQRYPVTTPPPINVTASIVGATIRLAWAAPAGTRFRVSYSTQFPAIWVPFPQEVTPVNGQCEFVDDGSFTGGMGQLRFYRVEQLP